METGHLSTRAVNSGSGNRALKSHFVTASNKSLNRKPRIQILRIFILRFLRLLTVQELDL